jgi:hypothetical protein
MALNPFVDVATPAGKITVVRLPRENEQEIQQQIAKAVGEFAAEVRRQQQMAHAVGEFAAEVRTLRPPGETSAETPADGESWDVQTELLATVEEVVRRRVESLLTAFERRLAEAMPPAPRVDSPHPSSLAPFVVDTAPPYANALLRHCVEACCARGVQFARTPVTWRWAIAPADRPYDGVTELGQDGTLTTTVNLHSGDLQGTIWHELSHVRDLGTTGAHFSHAALEARAEQFVQSMRTPPPRPRALPPPIALSPERLNPRQWYS